METLENYIGGKRRTARRAACMDVNNPATSEVCAQVPDSSQQDMEEAIFAAKAAYPKWPVTLSEEPLLVV